MPSKRRLLISCFLFFLVGQILFLISIQFPRGLYFDEFHYLPEAKRLWSLLGPPKLHHPPLGKWLIGLGIFFDQDRPLGWRLMSTFFGALSLVGTYLLGISLFKKQNTALFFTLLMLTNPLLYVHSRMATLEIFVFTFLVWGYASFCGAWNPKLAPRKVRTLHLISGIAFGLAISVKWSAFLLWIPLLLLTLGVRWVQQTTSPCPTPELESFWYSRRLFREISTKTLVFHLVLVPLLVYFFTFLPYLFFKDTEFQMTDLFSSQFEIWRSQLEADRPHPYSSPWWEWPLMIRPTWYFFGKEGDQFQFFRGVVAIGNPILLWGGAISLLIVFFRWLSKGRREEFLIIFGYFCFYFLWAIVPKETQFFYYYFPSTLLLSASLAWIHFQLSKTKVAQKIYFFVILTSSLFFFIYFFPIFSAIRTSTQSFSHWMWLPSWI